LCGGESDVADVSPLFIEAAVESIGGVLAADAEGVDRIELCGLLHEGAVTPSLGLITCALASVRTPIHVFIRPRIGDFVYDRHDVAVMLEDIAAAKAAGAPGVVFGALTRNSQIDRALMLELIAAARPMTVGFHRAFDNLADQGAGLETLIEIGVAVVLTSGGPARALEGAARLKALVEQASGRIDILAGGGITSENVAELLERSGVTQVHGKAFAGLRTAAETRP
jgi:copper homeostasis protein